MNTTSTIAVEITLEQQSKDPKYMAKFALRCLSEEHNKLLALAHFITCRLEPKDLENPSDDCDLMLWHLATVLEERLEKTDFEDFMRSLLLGEVK